MGEKVFLSFLNLIKFVFSEITPNDRFFVIYPCVEDVRGSIEGYEAGVSLPYQKETADKQVWLKNIMCKWRCEKNGRSRAMPHSKVFKFILLSPVLPFSCFQSFHFYFLLRRMRRLSMEMFNGC